MKTQKLWAIIIGLVLPYYAFAENYYITDGDVTKLITSINTANNNNVADTINLATNGTYTLTVSDFLGGPDGFTGLPSITSPVTFNGNGAVIERDTLASDFRILHVAVAGTLIMNNLTISNGFAGITNSCEDGGGIFNRGTVMLTNSTVSDCNVKNEGGGVYNLFGRVELSFSTIISNTAEECGGGITNQQGFILLTNSTISNNVSNWNAGGIDNNGGTIELTNSTVSANIASNMAGGILQDGIATIINCTIAENSSPVGGGIFVDSDNITMMNTIVAKNYSGGDCSRQIKSGGYNLDSDNSCGLNAPGDLSNIDPMLGLLQDNGGPTQTHTLLPNSPAIDKGNDTACPPTDQLGNPRVDGDGDGFATCDIGAIEFQVQIEVDINTYPKILSLKCKGNEIISMIRLPEKYNPHDIVRESLELSISSCSYCEAIYPNYGFPFWKRYLAAFSRQDLIDKIEAIDLNLPTKLELKIVGKLDDGTLFVGFDTVLVIK